MEGEQRGKDGATADSQISSQKKEKRPITQPSSPHITGQHIYLGTHMNNKSSSIPSVFLCSPTSMFLPLTFTQLHTRTRKTMNIHQHIFAPTFIYLSIFRLSLSVYVAVGECEGDAAIPTTESSATVPHVQTDVSVPLNFQVLQREFGSIIMRKFTKNSSCTGHFYPLCTDTFLQFLDKKRKIFWGGKNVLSSYVQPDLSSFVPFRTTKKWIQVKVRQLFMLTAGAQLGRERREGGEGKERWRWRERREGGGRKERLRRRERETIMVVGGTRAQLNLRKMWCCALVDVTRSVAQCTRVCVCVCVCMCVCVCLHPNKGNLGKTEVSFIQRFRDTLM